MSGKGSRGVRNSVLPNGLMCRYPVNSIPEVDQNVLGSELVSFVKQLFLGECCPESVFMLQFVL